MSDAEATGRDSRCLPAILASAALVFIPMLYVLSIGPAARMYDSASPSVRATLTTVYSPVTWLHDNTPLGRPIEWYVTIWNPVRFN